jgi:hypothetical protein
MISTRLPIFSMWPKWTLASHSMPIWMLAAMAGSSRPGMSSSFPLGAPLPSSAYMLFTGVL